MTSHAQVVENGVIRFNGVSSEDQGGYICSATNAVGTITATATLLVTGKLFCVTLFFFLCLKHKVTQQIRL